jgi:predicted anti-sigma-YlaC factor YlaD
VTHSEIRAQLSEYLERDLDPEERSRVEEHLGSCAHCAGELRDLRETVSLLRRLEEPDHPTGLADAVMTRIASQASGPARVRSLFGRITEPRIALALAAGLAGVFLMIQDDRSTAPAPLPADVARIQLQPEWTQLAAAPGRPPRAGVVSGATPSGAYTARLRRAHLEEMARQLRGAGHPFSESLAAHFEAQPTVALAGFQPR